MRRLLASLAFVLALSAAAQAADCYSNVAATQSNCAVVIDYLDVNSKSVPATDAAGLPVRVISGGGGAATGANNADGVASVATGLNSNVVYNFLYNGTTWDRLRGDTTNGAWVNVKAALPAGTNLLGTIDGTGKTTTQVSVAPTATTFASLLAASASRKGCTIQNAGATLGYIYFGATGSATTANSFQLAAGQPISCTAGNTVLTDNVAGTCASSTCAFIISSQ